MVDYWKNVPGIDNANTLMEKTGTVDKKHRGKVAAGLKKIAGMLRVSAEEEADDKELSKDLLKAYKEVSDAAKQAKSGKINLTTQVTDALEQAKVYDLVESKLGEADASTKRDKGNILGAIKQMQRDMDMMKSNFAKIEDFNYVTKRDKENVLSSMRQLTKDMKGI